jgi:hypothetical protein
MQERHMLAVLRHSGTMSDLHDLPHFVCFHILYLKGIFNDAVKNPFGALGLAFNKCC